MKKFQKIILSIFIPIICIGLGFGAMFVRPKSNASAEVDNGGGFYVGNNSTYTLDGNKAISGFSATGDGGGVYVANGGTFNMMGGDIFANTAGYGGGVFVSDTGTFNFSGGTISSNISTTDMGDGIYSYGTVKMTNGVIANNSVYIARGTFEMTGGSFANSPLTISSSVTSLTLSGSFVNSPIEIYGEGNIVRGITASSTGTALSFYNGQSFIESGKITGDISVATGATLYLNDNVEMVGTYILPGTAKMIVYSVNGEFPVMNIDATGHESSVLATYEGTNKPDISRINVTGFDAGQYEVVVEQSVTGDWEILLVDVSPKTFDTNWQTQLSSTLDSSSIDGSIYFTRVAKDGYSFLTKLDSGISVYKNVESSKTNICFASGTILAPSDCTGLFSFMKAESIVFENFDTTNVTSMCRMFADSRYTTIELSNFKNSKVTNMNYMFYSAGTNLTLDFSSLDMSKLSSAESAFHCSITELKLPNSLTTICEKMFMGSNISKLSIPSSVSTVKKYAFNGSTISDFDFSEGLKTIEYAAFQSFKTNSKIVFPASLTTFETSNGTTDLSDPADTFVGSNVKSFEFATGSKLTFMPRGIFYGCTSLEIAKIPEGVTTIGNSMFMRCSNLKDIYLPTTLKTLGDTVFDGGYSGVNIHISDVAAYLAIDCAGIYSIPTRLDGNLYEGETKITNLVVPGSVINFSGKNLLNCKSIISVTFSEGCKTIGQNSFEGCSNLTEISIPSTMTSFGYNAFSGYSFTKVTISDIESWCNISFGSNYILKGASLYIKSSLVSKLTIPSTLTIIPSYAFYGCESLTELDIPTTVTTFNSNSFTGCNNLAKVNIHDLESWYNVNFYDYTSNPLNGRDLYLNDTIVSNITVSSSVTKIKDFAFYGCKSLTSLSFENSNLLTIGNGSFAHCSYISSASFIGSGKINFGNAFYSDTGLKIVNINNLEAYCSSTFNDWSASPFCNGAELYRYAVKISTFTIPDSITSIPAYAFYGCGAYSELNLGNVTTIGDKAFYNSNITTLTSRQQSEISSLSNSGALDNALTWNLIYGSNKTINYLYSGIVENLNIGEGFESCVKSAFLNLSAKNVVFPSTFRTFEIDYNNKSDAFATNRNIEIVDFSKCEGLGTIGAGAFYQCENLKTVLLSTGVNTIDKDAFSGCLALETIDLSSVHNVYDNAFYNCINMVQTSPSIFFFAVGNNAFKNCRSITGELKVDILNNCGDYVFQGCTGITKVTISIDKNYNANTVFGAGMFAGCTRLQSATVNGGVGENTIDMFHSCTSLSSVTLSSDVTWLPQSMFYGCTALKYFEMPEYITDVGVKVFRKCSNLIDVTWSSSCSLKKISDQMFSECSSLETFNWSSKITEIGERAFEKCTSLKSGKTYSALRKIGANAFSDCSALSAVSYENPVWVVTSSDGSASDVTTITTASDFATKLMATYLDYVWTAGSNKTFTFTLPSTAPSTMKITPTLMTIAVGSSFGTLPTVSPSSYNYNKNSLEIIACTFSHWSINGTRIYSTDTVTATMGTTVLACFNEAQISFLPPSGLDDNDNVNASVDPDKDKMEINRGFTEYSDRVQTAILPNDKKGLKISIEKVEKD